MNLRIMVKGTKLLFDPFITRNGLANKIVNHDTVQIIQKPKKRLLMQVVH